MYDGKFQWDNTKAIANQVRQGVTFEMAREAFRDQSEDYGEDRFALVGMSERRLLFVAYAIRGESIRIISAPLPEPFERRRYHEENKE